MYSDINGSRKCNEFPQVNGKTVSIPIIDNSVPIKFGFIPNDFSATFIIDTNVNGSNSSVKLPGAFKYFDSIFVATTREIIQVTSRFEIYKLDITQNSSNWINLIRL